MRPMRSVLALVVTICAGVVFSGCSGSKGPRVKGKVTLDGKPLAGAQVTFEGAGGNTTVTNDAGEFELKGETAFDVIKPGEYNVIISKFVDPKGKVVEKEELDQLVAAGKAKQVVPARYSTIENTELRAKIVDGENTLPPFELKSR